VEADNGEGAVDEILKWIGEESSNVARERLDQFTEQYPSYSYKLRNVYSAWEFSQEKKSPPVMIEWALSIPFFSILIRQVGAAASAKRTNSEMSGDVTTSARQVLKNAYGYNVRFRRWECFQRDIFHADLQQVDTKRLPGIVMNLIEGSYRYGQSDRGEIMQLHTYANIIKDLLKTFGFRLRVKNPPADDFTFSPVNNDKEFLFGEAKECSLLPNETLPSGTSHELCLFGFATIVARFTPHPRSDRLTDLLGIRMTEIPQRQSHGRASEMAKSLLELGEGILLVAQSIKNMLSTGKVQSKDAVHLWTAVMQACHCSVSRGKQMSIVMSAHMMWFLRLFCLDDQCFIDISDGTSVGSGGCNKYLIFSLAYAQSLKNMDESSQRSWQKALQRDESDQEEDNSGNTNTSESQGDFDESNPQNSRVEGRGSIDRHSTQASSGLQVNPSILKPTQDFEDMNVKQHSVTRAISTDEADFTITFQGKDKYGVIPFFDQIGEPLEVLGHGRCGNVSKIKWGNGYAALKEFVIQPESQEDRYFYEVYEYELKVLDNLRPLWGKYVPALLFHKPWATSPMIGLQLGEPIKKDYIEDWPEEDQLKVKETMAKVKELGWKQEDPRGTNFVSLVDRDGIKRIAMIDFESLVPVVEK
jgi:hypothetical protein